MVLSTKSGAIQIKALSFHKLKFPQKMFLRKEEGTVVIDKTYIVLNFFLKCGKCAIFVLMKPGWLTIPLIVVHLLIIQTKPSIFSIFQKLPLNYNLIAKNTLSFLTVCSLVFDIPTYSLGADFILITYFVIVIFKHETIDESLRM